MCLVTLSLSAQDGLKYLPPQEPEQRTLTLETGETVHYRAYENIPYVANIEDPQYQKLNIYVPESAYGDNRDTPIFLRNYVGGYMAGRAGQPSTKDATGRALAEGYIVVIPGVRGSNSVVEEHGDKIYTGRAPAAILDLKAAVRFLRHNDATIPGNKDRIVSEGTSAGEAMSALLGASGNDPVYEPYLKAMGAADERDDIFAAVCFCPIIDLEHADMAYEWLYRGTNSGVRNLTPEQAAVSEELADLFAGYQTGLMLETPLGERLTASDYRHYLKDLLVNSARAAQDIGMEIPDSIGVLYGSTREGKREITDIDLDIYLEYLVKRQPLKTPPAFDPLNVLASRPSPENMVFGDAHGSSSNFTEFSLRKATADPEAELDKDLRQRVYLMNPMNFIGKEEARTAPHWYIRHGAADRDTAFQIPINFSTKLANCGYDVDVELAWDRGHSGDYDLDELFRWIAGILYRNE